MSVKPTSYAGVFLIVGLLFSSACSSSDPNADQGGNPNPVGPTPQQNTPAPNPTANLKGAVRMTVNPNPVPFSGKPITGVAGCRNRNNTWYYEIILEETGGVPVTFSRQIDAFDGSVNTRTSMNISVPARGTTTLNPRWCSSESRRHTARHSFTGADANGNALTIQG